MSSVTAELNQAKQAAREAFIEAAWRGDPPAALAELAEAAGLAGQEADRLLAEIRKARDLARVAETEPACRKAYERARRQADKAEAKARRLEAQAERIRAEATAALEPKKTVWLEAERAVENLADFFETTPELVPSDHLPRPVRDRLARRERERTEDLRQAERIHRLRIVQGIKHRIEALEAKLANLPLSPWRRVEERDLEAEIARLRARLSELEAGTA